MLVIIIIIIIILSKYITYMHILITITQTLMHTFIHIYVDKKKVSNIYLSIFLLFIVNISYEWDQTKNY